MSTSNADTEADYEVGYAKPPQATQFKKGKSGNPKGRPKASKNLETMLNEVFYNKVSITQEGSKRKITLLEAILRQLAHGAVKGEMRSIDRVIKLLPVIQEAQTAPLVDAESSSAEDASVNLAVLETLAEMFVSDADQLFASVQGGIDDDCPEF